MIDVPVRTEVLMGTLVTIHVVAPGTLSDAIERAFGWFREIEARCTRFDEPSELRQLTTSVGVAGAGEPDSLRGRPVRGDPSRKTPAARSIRRSASAWRRGVRPRASHRPDSAHACRTGRRRHYRDIEVDAARQTITLRRPLTLDLGAVAKGLAVDAAARELQPFTDFAIDAGGDLYLGGRNPEGAHGRSAFAIRDSIAQLIDSLRVSDKAVCTSGDYERAGNPARRSRESDRALAIRRIRTSHLDPDVLSHRCRQRHGRRVPPRCWPTRSGPPRSCSARRRASGFSSATASRD